MSGADDHTEQCRECPHAPDLDQLVSGLTDAKCVKEWGGGRRNGRVVKQQNGEQKGGGEEGEHMRGEKYYIVAVISRIIRTSLSCLL